MKGKLMLKRWRRKCNGCKVSKQNSRIRGMVVLVTIRISEVELEVIDQKTPGEWVAKQVALMTVLILRPN